MNCSLLLAFVLSCIIPEIFKLHNEKLHDLYCSHTIVRVIKSRRMRGAGHVVRMGRGEVDTRLWWGNLKERTTGETQA
jgi:hypothetical protein